MGKITDEMRKEKRDEIAWRNKIRLFEESHACINVRYLLFGDGRMPEDNPPWFSEFLIIVVLCIRTAYVNAYGFDNLTSQLYFELCQRLHGLPSVKDPKEFEEQKKKLNKLLDHIPGEFAEYTAVSGIVQSGSGKGISLEEFQGLLNYLGSVTFDVDSVHALSKI